VCCHFALLVRVETALPVHKLISSCAMLLSKRMARCGMIALQNDARI
jgi:hypothetical protein